MPTLRPRSPRYRDQPSLPPPRRPPPPCPDTPLGLGSTSRSLKLSVLSSLLTKTPSSIASTIDYRIDGRALSIGEEALPDSQPSLQHSPAPNALESQKRGPRTRLFLPQRTLGPANGSVSEGVGPTRAIVVVNEAMGFAPGYNTSRTTRGTGAAIVPRIAIAIMLHSRPWCAGPFTRSGAGFAWPHAPHASSSCTQSSRFSTSSSTSIHSTLNL